MHRNICIICNNMTMFLGLIGKKVLYSSLKNKQFHGIVEQLVFAFLSGSLCIILYGEN